MPKRNAQLRVGWQSKQLATRSLHGQTSSFQKLAAEAVDGLPGSTPATSKLIDVASARPTATCLAYVRHAMSCDLARLQLAVNSFHWDTCFQQHLSQGLGHTAQPKAINKAINITENILH